MFGIFVLTTLLPAPLVFGLVRLVESGSESVVDHRFDVLLADQRLRGLARGELTAASAARPEAVIQAKRSTAKRILSQEDIRAREARDWFTFPGVSQQDALDDIAKRVYEERSRQELEGHVRTAEMTVDTESGKSFDLLSLAAGDSIVVQIDPESRQLLAAKKSDRERKDYLLERGYSPDAAALIISNMKEFAALEAKFLAKSVTTELESSDEGGHFSVEFEYVNRIQLDGSAVAQINRSTVA